MKPTPLLVTMPVNKNLDHASSNAPSSVLCVLGTNKKEVRPRKTVRPYPLFFPTASPSSYFGYCALVSKYASVGERVLRNTCPCHILHAAIHVHPCRGVVQYPTKGLRHKLMRLTSTNETTVPYQVQGYHQTSDCSKRMDACDLSHGSTNVH